MSAPTPPIPREWWTRPATVLPLVATIVVLVALFSPQAASGRFGDPRLSSHLAGSLGARVLADLSTRLGWRVVQRDSVAAPRTTDGRTIHAVLAPSVPLTASEAHQYLSAVRAGDALLVVLDRPSVLADSLHVTHFARGGYLPKPVLAPGECGRDREPVPPLWADGRVQLWGVRWLRGVPSDRRVFATLEPSDLGPANPGPAAAGFSFGQGRIVVVGDPDLLRNDVIRHCRWGADVIVVAMMEYLRAGGPSPRTTLAFDEYHHGYGPRATIMSATSEFLVGHPVGRALLMGVLAALVLLLAKAPRAIPPQDVERIERRDPLEQMDALAHAYEQVHATRTITSRLLHGVRRRVERGAGARSGEDDAFLHAVRSRAPALADDVAVVERGLRDAVSARDLTEIGAALRRIEHTLTTTNT